MATATTAIPAPIKIVLPAIAYPPPTTTGVVATGATTTGATVTV